jgi:hypothetical protein
MTSSLDVYEIRPRKDRRGFDLIGERLPLGLLWFEGADAMGDAVNYARFFSRSHSAIIRVFDDSGMLAKTLELVGDYSQNKQNACCVFLQATLNVHVNMIEPTSGESLSLKDNRLLAPKGSQARYTGELLLRTRPKTYRAIVRELAEPNASVNGISRRYRVSNHTVIGIREREAKSIAERKKHLISMLADVATVGAERMPEKIGKASLRDAAIGTGVAVDKMLALSGQTPAFQIANVVMPSEAEREERRAMHDKLDEIARRLADAPAPAHTRE